MAFSGNVVRAASYASYSDQQLTSLKASRKALKDQYKQQGDKYYNLAQPYRYKSGSAALSTYTRYMKLSISYRSKVVQLSSEIAEIEKELTRRKNKLVSISIVGDSSVAYRGSKVYKCKAKYKNGTVKVVTATWKVSNSSYGSFSGNRFTAKVTGAGKTVVITASFDGKKVTKKLTLKKRVLQSLTIKGPSTVTVGGKAVFTCMAKFADAKSAGDVCPKWTVSNSKYASLNGCVLYAKSAGSGKSVTVTATFGGKKVSRTVKIRAASSSR